MQRHVRTARATPDHPFPKIAFRRDHCQFDATIEEFLFVGAVVLQGRFRAHLVRQDARAGNESIDGRPVGEVCSTWHIVRREGLGDRDRRRDFPAVFLVPFVRRDDLRQDERDL